MLKTVLLLFLATAACTCASPRRTGATPATCNYLPFEVQSEVALDPSGLTWTSPEPLPRGDFDHYINIVGSNGLSMPGCDAVSEKKPSGDAEVFIPLAMVANCTDLGSDGYIYARMQVLVVSSAPACRSNASDGYPMGYPIEIWAKCARLDQKGSSTVAATAWQSWLRTCNTCPIIDGKVQATITAAKPNVLVGEPVSIKIKYDNLDARDKLAYDTQVMSVELTSGGNSKKVPFTVDWEGSVVKITFDAFKPSAQPETQVIVMAEHTWNLLEDEEVENPKGGLRAHNSYTIRNNEVKSETSARSVLVYIDEQAVSTPTSELATPAPAMPSINTTTTPPVASGSGEIPIPVLGTKDDSAGVDIQIKMPTVPFVFIMIGAVVGVCGCQSAQNVILFYKLAKHLPFFRKEVLVDSEPASSHAEHFVTFSGRPEPARMSIPGSVTSSFAFEGGARDAVTLA